jgi:hypothetical protein
LKIAGHEFEADGKCSCRVRFADIATVDRSDIGKLGYCHTGNLTENEYNEIVRERDRIWSTIHGVASGSGPISPPIYEDVPMHDDSYIGC